MRAQKELRRRSVFINVPFDKAYEPLFVALISSLIAVGRTPCYVLQVAEQGEGQLSRIFKLMEDCSVSVHDLSRAGLPVRFNMPFELGIAYALRQLNAHKFVLLEAKRYRLQRTLSDLNGIDSGIHGGTVYGMVSCILSSLGKPRMNPDPQQIHKIRRQLWRAIPVFKRNHHRTTIYTRAIFQDLLTAASLLAKEAGLIVVE